MMTWRHPDLSAIRVVRLLVVLACARSKSSFHRLLHVFGEQSQVILMLIVQLAFLSFVALVGQQVLDIHQFSTYFRAFVSCLELSMGTGMKEMLEASEASSFGILSALGIIFIAFFLNVFVFRLSIPLMAHNCELPEKFKITYQIFFCIAMRKEVQAWTHPQEHRKLYEIFRKVVNANHTRQHSPEVRHPIRSALRIWHEQEDVLKKMSVAFAAAAANSTHSYPDDQNTSQENRSQESLRRAQRAQTKASLYSQRQTAGIALVKSLKFEILVCVVIVSAALLQVLFSSLPRL
jgi:hypothetical protein